MSETTPTPADLQHVERVAALGYLLNAIAHDLNNLLTNLMLGVDQVQYGGGAEAVELLVEQVQRVTAITRAVQRLGQRNMGATAETLELADVVTDAAGWYSRVWPDDPMTVGAVGPARLRASRLHLTHALTLLAYATTRHHGGAPLCVLGGTEDVPRSAWAGTSDTVAMVVIRVRRGSPGAAGGQEFKRLVDGFFEGERGDHDVATMAAWEVLRKLRGRLRVRGGPGEPGVEYACELPVAEGP